MAHFAVLNESNVVTNVVVIADADCLDGDGNESEAVGIAFCKSLFGDGNYVQTSYNANMRKAFAQIDGTYDSTKDKFIPPQPWASWALDSNDDWQPPIPLPDNAKVNIGADGHMYAWDEDAYQADNSTGWKDLGV